MRFVLIGAGGFGKVWVNALHAEPRAEIAALVDLSPAAIEQACATLGLTSSCCFSDLGEALAAVEADALVCATPPHLHRAHVTYGLEAGLHVISEKPMAATPEDCTAMVRSASRSGKVYAVSQNYRYRPGMFALANAVREGLVGDVGQVRVDFYKGTDFGGGFRHEMPFPVLVDMAVHHFDLLRYITGQTAVRVSGAAWNPPWSNYKGHASSSVCFEMNGGARAVYNASWCAQGDYCDWNGNWLIEGTRGALTYHCGTITHHRVGSSYKVVANESLPLTPLAKEGQAFVLDHFITCVEAGEQPETSCFDNIHSINMVFAALEAVQRDTWSEIRPAEEPSLTTGG